MTHARARITILVALASTLLLGAACANGGSNGSAAGGGGSSGTSVTGSTDSSGATGSATGTSGGGGGGRYGYGSGGGGGGGKGDSNGNSANGSTDVALTADNFAFSPTSVTVESGTQISVENANGSTPHSFTVDGTDIDVTLVPGTVQVAEIDLDPGTYSFHCRYHASMTGTLTVT